MAAEEKANLRELSQHLSQASSLIDVILQQPTQQPPQQPPNSSFLTSSERVSLSQALSQNERTPACPEATRNQARNRTSESLSSQHVSSATSAVNRARLMIEQSSSRGLYSRLGKKERLRATKPASESKPKKPRVDEKPKVFEFVLLQIEIGESECEDTEKIVYEENMVALRGFIEVTKAATEKDIRRNLGEAIRIKYPLVTDTDFEFVRANRRRITKPVSVGEYNYQQVKLLAGQGCIYLKMKDGVDCVLVEDVRN